MNTTCNWRTIWLAVMLPATTCSWRTWHTQRINARFVKSGVCSAHGKWLSASVSIEYLIRWPYGQFFDVLVDGDRCGENCSFNWHNIRFHIVPTACKCVMHRRCYAAANRHAPSATAAASGDIAVRVTDLATVHRSQGPPVTTVDDAGARARRWPRILSGADSRLHVGEGEQRQRHTGRHDESGTEARGRAARDGGVHAGSGEGNVVRVVGADGVAACRGRGRWRPGGCRGGGITQLVDHNVGIRTCAVPLRGIGSARRPRRSRRRCRQLPKNTAKTGRHANIGGPQMKSSGSSGHKALWLMDITSTQTGHARPECPPRPDKSRHFFMTVSPTTPGSPSSIHSRSPLLVSRHAIVA